MQIRSAAKDDAKAIAEIIKRHFATDYMGFPTFDESYIKNKMKNDWFLVAESGDKIIGCVRLALVDFDLADIRTLCVDEEFRGKGIGQKLLDEGLKLMSSKGMRKLIARVKADNASGIKFFEKNGFRQEGHFREHYRKGIDVVQFYRFI